MGNQPPPRPQQKVSIDDAIIDMKIQSKQVARAAKTSQKQSQAYMKRAKQALKKNNQQGAKLFLVSASQKKNQSLNFQRTAVKMDIMCDRIKSMKNNETLVQTFGKMSNVINQQMNSLDAVKMAQSMDVLNQQMDNMMINNKMMGEMMSQGQVVHDQTVNQMMNVLKQELTLEDTNKMNQYIPSQQQKNVNINAQQNQQQNNTMYTGASNNGNGGNNNPKGGMKEQVHNDPFLDELKDL